MTSRTAGVVMGSLVVLAAWSASDAKDDAAGDAVRIVSRHTAVFTAPPRRVPTNKMVDGPVLGNGGLGVTLAGPPERQVFAVSKNDLWSYSRRCVIAVGGLVMDCPALAGASYRQEQDLLKAEVRGTFTAKGLTVHTRSWTAAGENLLVTELSCSGQGAAAVSLSPYVGAASGGGGRPAPGRPGGGGAINIGREQHGTGRWYFNGLIDDVRIYDRALSGKEVRTLCQGGKVPGGLLRHWPLDEGSGAVAKDAAGKTHGKVVAGTWADGKAGKALKLDGKGTYVDAGALGVTRAVTIAAWVRPDAFQPTGWASYILSRGDWNHAYSLGLSAGMLRMAIGPTFAQTPGKLALGKWQHVAGTFDGSTIRVFVDGMAGGRPAGSSGGGPVAVTAEGDTAWFARRADPATVANARTVAVATRVIGAETKAKGPSLSFQLTPGSKVTVISVVLSDLDARGGVSAAKKRAAEIEAADLAAMNTAHQQWWRDYWARSFIEIPDKLIEKHWYGAQYIMASCSRAGKVPPGLFGNWITTDAPAWRGDFHLNYNHEAPFWGLYASNRVETAASYETPIMEFLPQAKANARKLLKCRGVYYPVGLGPWGIASGNIYMGQKSNAAYATTNMIMRFYHTYDMDYARKIAYPFLLEVGTFWEDYLKFENGRYVIYNDAIHENHTPHDMNPILSLGLVRTLFASLVDISRELGVDAARRKKWQHIHDNLSTFPLQERGGKTVFRYSEKGQAWFGSNTLGIQHIFPAGAIGLDSDPKLLQISRDTITVLNRWTDYNGFATFYTAAARVGYDPRKILTELRGQCQRHAYPNLQIFHGGGGIEECAGIMLAPIEMLLQSHEKVLRLFPCWPRHQPARFGRLRAVGAFLVSSEIKGGRVQHVTITSEKGRACTVVNPWPGKGAVLTRQGGQAETFRKDRFTFKTAPGETVELRPAD